MEFVIVMAAICLFELTKKIIREVFMTSYTALIETEVNVSFSEPEKAKAFFINGSWKDIYWTLESMTDLVESITHAVHKSEEQISPKELEIFRSCDGFSDFIKQEDGAYLSSYERYGEIRVEYADPEQIGEITAIKDE